MKALLNSLKAIIAIISAYIIHLVVGGMLLALGILIPFFLICGTLMRPLWFVPIDMAAAGIGYFLWKIPKLRDGIREFWKQVWNNL